MMDFKSTMEQHGLNVNLIVHVTVGENSDLTKDFNRERNK